MPRWLLPALVFALPFALYLATLAPGVLNDDPGEYQLVVGALGVAHPTGYPLYTLLGHLFTLLVPIGTIAWRVNLFSALAGAGACLALYGLLRHLTISTWIAASVAFLFAVSADAWFYATMAQTYALNSLLITLVLWAYVVWLERRNARSFAALCLVAGLGVAHHSTFWLLAPALAIGLAIPLIVDYRAGALRVTVGALRGVVAGGVAFALPVALYLYIPIRGEQLLAAMPGGLFDIPQAVVSGMLTPHYLAGWTNVVAGSFYSGDTLGGASVDWGRALTTYAASLFLQFPGIVLLAFGILDARVWRGRAAFVTVLLVAWVTNVVIVTRGVAAFNEPAGGLYTPTWIFAAIAIALTWDRIRVVNSRQWLAPVGGAALLVFGVMVTASSPGVFAGAGAAAQSGGLDRSDEHAARAGSALGADVPRDAVMLGAWSPVTAVHFAQTIDGVRPDVAVLQAPLAAPAGRAFARNVVDAGRALYFLDERGQPSGVSLPARPPIAHPLSADFGGQLELIGYDVGDLIPGDSGPSKQGVHLYWRTASQPATDYKVFVRCVRGSEVATCSPDKPVASEFFPTSIWTAGRYAEHIATVWQFGSADALEVGVYDGATGRRLALPDGSTTVRIPWR